MKISVSRIYLISMAMVAMTLTVGCGHKPEGTLSEKKMVRLMADMQLAEAYSDTEYMGQDIQDRREELAKSVLAENGVTQEELDSTLSWYGRNLDDYNELFKKVDKEIEARKRKILKTEDKYADGDQGDMLWPYAKNGMISSLGTSDGWVISVDNPSLGKGDIVEWKMHLDKMAQITGVLGVDYTDGTSEAATNVISGRPSIELRLQTDTSKTVSRLYGTLRLKDKDIAPLFADSITLRRLPYDSLEFRKYRNQKHYGIPVKKVIKRSADADTLSTANTVVNDSTVSIKSIAPPPHLVRDANSRPMPAIRRKDRH